MHTQQKPSPLRFFPKKHLILLLFVTGSLAAAIFTNNTASEPVRRLLAPPVQLLSDIVSSAEAEPLLSWKTLTIKSGDSLSSLLDKAGFNAKIVEAIASTQHATMLRMMRPSESFSVGVDSLGELKTLKYHPSKIRTVIFNAQPHGFQSHVIERDYDRLLKYTTAAIDDALFLTAQAAGLDDNITMQLIHIFAWDIDFAMDIRKGDSFEMVYEELWLDGEKIKNGKILIANFTNQDTPHQAIRFTDNQGNNNYYDASGRSLKKAFIRTPVDFTRISSKFSLKRRHPVLNKVRAHKGIDYAAARGTQVKSAGAGTITFAGKKGGYGNVLIIQHGQKYSTLYAHLKKFARGMRKGKKVTQGQAIAYVGSSGLATGPHLHYEFRVNGIHKNPLSVKFPDTKPVPQAQKPDFLAKASELQDKLTLLQQAYALNNE